jgi:hypothetical protein
MTSIEKIVEGMESNPADIKFSDFLKVCIHFFGEPRKTGGSHIVFKKPWKGNPPVIIQPTKGKAKEYQVKQVLIAIKKLEEGQNV